MYVQLDVQRKCSVTNLTAGTLTALLRRSDPSPFHIQVEDGLRQLIRSGQVAPGTELPGELSLAETLGLSRHTIRHAMQTLVTEGLLRRERGRGTHVLDAGRLHIRQLHQFYAFAWEMASIGIEERSRVLRLTRVAANAELTARLGLKDEEQVLRVDRIRIADSEPLVLETSYLPHDLSAGLDRHSFERGSIYDQLEQALGVRVTGAQEVISPIVVSRLQARHLRVAAGSAAFKVERTTWAGSRAIEWQESIVRGDRYLYTVDLDRSERDVS
jgi:GntR family transcriptional regulator